MPINSAKADREVALYRPASKAFSILLWSIRFLAVVATLISCYLLVTTLDPSQKIAGCGGANADCGQVLGSRWSLWFDLPVSGPAVAVYLGIFLATWLIPRRSTPRVRQIGWALLAALAATAVGAALWFIGLQIWQIGSTCRYCLAVHGCGLFIGALTTAAWTMSAARAPATAAAPSGWVLCGALLAAICLLGTLVGGQQLSSEPEHARYELTLSGHVLDFDPQDFPRIGSPDAPHLLVVMSDYTCPHCQKTHPLIIEALRRYHGQIAVVAVPVPMSARCNPRIPFTVPASAEACELAHLALSVWRAKPAAFPPMDEWLFATPMPRKLADARRFAADLVGEQALAKAEADPIVQRTLSKCIEMYGQIGGGLVPKIIIRHTSRDGHVVVGEVPNSEAIDQIIEKDMGVRPQ